MYFKCSELIEEVLEGYYFVYKEDEDKAKELLKITFKNNITQEIEKSGTVKQLRNSIVNIFNSELMYNKNIFKKFEKKINYANELANQTLLMLGITKERYKIGLVNEIKNNLIEQYTEFYCVYELKEELEIVNKLIIENTVNPDELNLLNLNLLTLGLGDYNTSITINETIASYILELSDYNENEIHCHYCDSAITKSGYLTINDKQFTDEYNNLLCFCDEECLTCFIKHYATTTGLNIIRN